MSDGHFAFSFISKGVVLCHVCLSLTISSLVCVCVCLGVAVCALGVAVLVAPHVPLLVGVDSRQQFCLQSGSSLERPPLQYTVCVGENPRDLHQEVAPQQSLPARELPNLGILRWVRPL